MAPASHQDERAGLGQSDAGSGSGSAPPRAPQSTDQQQLAEAYRELARGEQAAITLETSLTRLERKLDDILAALEASTAAGSGQLLGGGKRDGGDSAKAVGGSGAAGKETS